MADLSVTVSETQRQTILNALTERLVEAEGYLRSSQVSDTPLPEHECCDFHRMRYERDRELHLAMKARKRAVKSLIGLFSETPKE